MKRRMYLAIAALAVMFAAPQQSNAQFFKKLGKIAEDIGNTVLESALSPTTENTESSANNTVSQSTTANALSAEQKSGIKIVSGNPDFKIEVLRCAASETNVLLELRVTNIGESDVKEFRVQGYGTKFYDNLGNIYDGDIQIKIANKEYTPYSQEIRLVAGVPTKISYTLKEVSTKAASFALVEPNILAPDWNVTQETVKLRNVPITR